MNTITHKRMQWQTRLLKVRLRTSGSAGSVGSDRARGGAGSLFFVWCWWLHGEKTMYCWLHRGYTEPK